MREQPMTNYEGWKDYQARLQRQKNRKDLLKKGICFFPLLLIAVLGVQFIRVSLSTGHHEDSSELTGPVTEQHAQAVPRFDKKKLRSILDLHVLCASTGGMIDLDYSGDTLSIETTLDRGLQDFMSEQVRDSLSPIIAFVAIDPATGRVLSMVESRKADIQNNQFPAASIFKIVTAAAAIESCNMSGDTTLAYNGRSHTLYKNQLKDRTNRYTNKVSLKESFAKSINPVFGKLGILRLKKELLEEYAARFGFNQPIDFELIVEPSTILVGDDPYHWAELACGFNRETLISPLHGAMIASVISNSGTLVQPTIVEYVVDSQSAPVYVGGDRAVRKIISRKTSDELKKMMVSTVRSGTSRRTFKGYRKDPVLSNLVIGGKTGSINNKTCELRYDWFVGFCEEKTGPRKLAIAVLVVHDRLLRKKAGEFARLAMKRYFS
ncbi:MAG: PbpA [Desulfobacterales bacterium]|nr:PbpA [Desulfobacterales bacterium]